MAGVYMYIDASELDGLISSMREKLTPPEFDRLMKRTLNEVGRRMKTPIKRRSGNSTAPLPDLSARGSRARELKAAVAA